MVASGRIQASNRPGHSDIRSCITAKLSLLIKGLKILCLQTAIKYEEDVIIQPSHCLIFLFNPSWKDSHIHRQPTFSMIERETPSPSFTVH